MSRKSTGGVEESLHALLTSALDARELSNSRPGSFTPGERTPVPTGKEEGGRELMRPRWGSTTP